MKKLLIEAKYNGPVNVSRIKVGKLPQKIGLVASLQFVDFLDEIKNFLEKNGKKVFLEKGYQKYAGQVLGCEQSAAKRIAALVDAFLYIGDGRFHAIGVKMKTGKEVFTFNPLSDEFSWIEKGVIEKIQMKRKAMLMKFYSSKEIGIIICTKDGQNKLNEAREFKRRYPEKNFYLVLFDNVDYSQLENFNFIECWINAACPRIEEDTKVINLQEIK